ncbi:hypothetical protein Cch01nite_37070 [Cellulomonas chitinilytica]|uniref:Uncharacterized protein n=1 Tax=Cellulomonas chitinilytica TaxID=398759 RepID=A0A919P4A6_9CELL|nr:hypothetical protein [Cellulomonas chitinilytica]GIG22983.1 hypothetical protein Cch01nite_37070 [Cellulomonas chitinilytica]
MDGDFAQSDPNGALIRLAGGLASTTRRGRKTPKIVVIGVCLLTGFVVLVVALAVASHFR